jgi:phenylalanyl-tRNA synthetase beta chain
MRISIEWLRDFLDLPEDLGRMRQELSMVGLVVESMTETDGGPVFEIEITSNRPDCLSHIGVAREIAALYGKKLKAPPVSRVLRAAEERIPYSIEIHDPDLCPRYVGLVFDGIKVAPAPAWMQRRLEAAGMRPVNNVVDITNYVLLERGHPLHAFDFDRLRQGKIVVARASAGQKMVTLDGIERELDDQMLLINDGGGPVAIAGVMGGLNSEISSGTTRVLLECAYFLPVSVRRTSKKLQLSTEASYRFERGADWDGVVAASARTSCLLQKYAGARIAGSMQDVCPAPIVPARIPLERAHAERLLGVSIPSDFIESTLKRLRFKPARKGRGKWLIECPSYRADMELEADLIEEIARFFGYQNIPATLPPSKRVGAHSPVYEYEQAARRILRGLGYSETMSLSFARQEDHAKFPLPSGHPLEIRNPLTEDTQSMRGRLAPGLVRVARHNFHHDQREVRIFEIGKTFARMPDGSVDERHTAGILGTGAWSGKNWHNPAPDYDFFHIKGAVCSLLAGLRCAPFEIVPAGDVPWLDEAESASVVVEERRLGVLGRLHPGLEGELKLKQPVYLAEIDFQPLMPYLFAPVSFQSLARFPAVDRDISIVVPKEVSYSEIRKGILGLGVETLASVDLVDVYEGDPIPPGKMSLTLRLVFLDRESTLTVDRVQGFSDNMRNFLREHFGAEGR